MLDPEQREPRGQARPIAQRVGGQQNVLHGRIDGRLEEDVLDTGCVGAHHDHDGRCRETGFTYRAFEIGIHRVAGGVLAGIVGPARPPQLGPPAGEVRARLAVPHDDEPPRLTVLRARGVDCRVEHGVDVGIRDVRTGVIPPTRTL
jgi:hypothetical protein